MKKAIIGITVSIDGPEGTVVKREKDYYYLKRDYCQRVQEMGGIPIMLTPEISPREVMELCDGVILSGGNDIPAKLYGETSRYPDLYEEEHPERVNWECAIIDAFYQANKPVLGICYGMQLLNVHFGGSLYQDIEKDLDISLHVHGCTESPSNHIVRITSDSRLGALLGQEVAVCSIHHQAIHRLAPDFQIIAKSEDDIIEAISYKNMLGVEWHPESDATGKKIFAHFIASC
ncbi:MAG: gamma-glutamyl-gamma-aminobutyrate hydrolase family protein [Spirochaetota bacterium]